MTSTFDAMDFVKNSRDILVVRALRVADIMKALRCSLSFAYQVMNEIRGPDKADGKFAFVLPSQLAAWAYQRARGEAEPKPVRLAAPALPSETLKRSLTAKPASASPIPITTPRTKAKKR